MFGISKLRKTGDSLSSILSGSSEFGQRLLRKIVHFIVYLEWLKII